MPRVWQDRIVQYPKRFKDQNGNTLILTPDPGTITQVGTPVNATMLNGVESDLADSLNILAPGGTANAITLPVTLADKKKYSFKATANSTGTVTVNGVPFKKLDGTVIGSGGVKINKVYDFYYDSGASSVFILAKAEGDAVVGDVLAGKFFSNGDDTGLVGTATIASLGGKRWASGTTKSASSMIVFKDINNNDAYAYPLTVSSLAFKPSIVIIFESGIGGTIVNTKVLVQPQSVVGINVKGASAIFQLTGVSQINNNGFVLPTFSGNTNLYWEAIE